MSVIPAFRRQKQSFVHASLMPGLVDKAILCLGYIKIKSNSDRATREEKGSQRPEFRLASLATWCGQERGASGP